jgi:hypothetical protein
MQTKRKPENDLEQKLSSVEGINKEQEELFTKCSQCLGKDRDEYLKLTQEGNEALKKKKEELVSLRKDNKKKREQQKEATRQKELEEEKKRQEKVTGQKPPEKDPKEKKNKKRIINKMSKSEFFKRTEITNNFEQIREGIYKAKDPY